MVNHIMGSSSKNQIFTFLADSFSFIQPNYGLIRWQWAETMNKNHSFSVPPENVNFHLQNENNNKQEKKTELSWYSL